MLRREIIKKYFNNKSTKSGWYLLATLGHIPDFKPKGLYLKEQLGNTLIDVYLIDDSKLKLVSVYDYLEEDDADDIMKWKLSNDYTFVESNQDIENNEIWIINEIPDDFLKDYEMFKLGKYSQFSGKLKDRLMIAHGKTVGEGFSKITGLPAVSVYESLFPNENKEKKKILADFLSVKESEIKELLQPPDLEFEKFRLIKDFEEYARSSSK